MFNVAFVVTGNVLFLYNFFYDLSHEKKKERFPKFNLFVMSCCSSREICLLKKER